FMVFDGIIARLMTLHAEGVVGYVRFKLQAVGIMAVVAFNALIKHLALQKGAIHVDLLFYLSVREIRLRVGKGRVVKIQEIAGVIKTVGHIFTQGVALGALIDLFGLRGVLSQFQILADSLYGCPLNLF